MGPVNLPLVDPKTKVTGHTTKLLEGSEMSEASWPRSRPPKISIIPRAYLSSLGRGAGAGSVQPYDLHLCVPTSGAAASCEEQQQWRHASSGGGHRSSPLFEVVSSGSPRLHCRSPLLLDWDESNSRR